MSFSPAQLHVIAVLNNPVRYASRDRLFGEFAARMNQAGVSLTVIEAAFYDRPHAFTHPSRPADVQVVQRDEIWLKENLINLAVSRLPKNWEYVAWIDADVAFSRPDWAAETIHQLQHYKIVQMFETAIDLGPTQQALEIFNGFAYSFIEGLPPVLNNADAYYGGAGFGGKFWHPGYAWAMNRNTWDDLGGLMDQAILGAADHHMALAMIGEGARSVPPDLTSQYVDMVMNWQRQCDLHVKRDIGCVPGTLFHHWHGRKKDRRYADRWGILRKWKFNPLTDIKRDWQGLWTFTSAGNRMRNDIRAYFRARNEDSIDLA